MSKKIYKLKYLPLFENDLNEIIDYICNHLKNPIAANKLVNKIETGILKRRHCPLAFAPYKTSIKTKSNYYWIPIDNYIVFYTIIGDVMEIRRVLYKRRNITPLLPVSLKSNTEK